MTVTIRRRGTEDLPHLAQVLLRVHDVDGYPVEGVAAPEKWLQPPRELASWTAEYQGIPIGQVSLMQADPRDDAAATWTQATGQGAADIAIPVRLFVDPPHRRRGAGNLLMAAAHEYATQHGLRLVFDVMLKDQAAIELYERLGCERLGMIEHRHSGGQIEPAAVYKAPRALDDRRTTRPDTGR